MNPSDTMRGRAVLTIAHVAGMIDMVALPIWIGTLIQSYGYSAPQAGVTVTLFLLGGVIASVALAPRFGRWPRRATTALGFLLAAGCFGVASLLPILATSFVWLALLHFTAGLGVGCALSITHGTIGRSSNPHRLFALVSAMLGIFAVGFLAAVPQLQAAIGVQYLFVVFAGTLGVAAIATGAAFPRHSADMSITASTERALPIPRSAWYVIAVVICLTLNQSMVFAFVERIGADHAYGTQRVQGVLIAIGMVNLLPGMLAGLLQKHLSPLVVGALGPIGQALLALAMTSSGDFSTYAIAASMYVSVVIFTHTFMFGLLSSLDSSGRAVAATPAMMMVGACLGPAIGGGLVSGLGYEGLGWAACAIATVAVVLMLQLRRHLAARTTLLASSHV